MVQQMIDSKFNEYGVVNGGNGMPTSDKLQAVPGKKVAPRDLQNESGNITPKATGSSPLSKRHPSDADNAVTSGIKRHKPDCSPSAIGSSGSNGHLVYHRRKTETEPGKANCSEDRGNSSSPHAGKSSNEKQEVHHQQQQLQEPKISCYSAFAPIPVASVTSPVGSSLSQSLGIHGISYPPLDLNNAHATRTPVLGNGHRLKNLHWKERFLQLQMNLQRLDQSNQEDYMQMLRSLSAAGRSRHAVELEKRAIQLLLEEGKEIQRMKLLNVLGKASPNNTPPSANEAFSPYSHPGK
ncbi:hypothetical protein QJS10_CPB15g00240 [Acorus calamus]|uniref:Uncharacterized protein n=1 Tax=Acorus calamus TaxID=4465 RepID=A0AAV9D4Z8_ACOCL|nr:hypothetical protein QJS10_CPB15g00240 [Acorus calamus]